MPELSRQTKLPYKWVGHRERLAELGAVIFPIGLFIEEKVKVVVKPLRVNAREYQTRITRATNVEIGRLPAVDTAEIADCDRGIQAFTTMHNSLHTQPHASLAYSGLRS